jgi:hypothetical protein
VHSSIAIVQSGPLIQVVLQWPPRTSKRIATHPPLVSQRTVPNKMEQGTMYYQALPFVQLLVFPIDDLRVKL